MSFAVVHSRALDALEAQAVTVEVHLANGLPSFTLVGLADTEVKESRDGQKNKSCRISPGKTDRKKPGKPCRSQLRTTQQFAGKNKSCRAVVSAHIMSHLRGLAPKSCGHSLIFAADSGTTGPGR